MRYFLLESTLSVKLYSFASYAASLKQSLRPLPIVCITSKTFKFCRSFFVGNCIFQYFVDKVLFSIEKHLKCNFFLNLIESSDISTTHLPFSDVRENYLLFSTFEPISMWHSIVIVAIHDILVSDINSYVYEQEFKYNYCLH